VEKFGRFRQQYGLNPYDASVLVAEQPVADYFERAVAEAERSGAGRVRPKTLANWITGELFGLLNQAGTGIEMARVPPEALVSLLSMVAQGELNQNSAKSVLAEMFLTGKSAQVVVAERGLVNISDAASITQLVSQVLEQNPGQVAEFLAGKEAIFRWLFGRVMRAAKGQADPQLVQQELERQLGAHK
jgi:aspartyl-tRNA(Asn)/glutamyl-tRNA(Gln) amidotransferase subunit B